MASTSLSYNFANINVDKIIRDAFAQCGRSNSLISGWQYNMANDAFNFLMSSWISKKGLNLFTVEQDMIEIIPGQYKYALPLNTSKILECTIANSTQIITPGMLAKASTADDDIAIDALPVFSKIGSLVPIVAKASRERHSWYHCIFPVPQPIQYVGILPGLFDIADDPDASREMALNIQCSFSLQAIIPEDQWITILEIPKQQYYEGQRRWVSLPYTENARSWRVISREEAPISIMQISLNIPTSTKAMNRIGRDKFTFMPVNTNQGAPTTCYVDRNTTPVLNIYQTPNSNPQWQFFVYNRVRSIQDAGEYTNSVDMTPRFLEAAVTGLAARLSRSYAPDKTQMLHALAEQLFLEAAREDTENVDMQVNINSQQGYIG